MLSVRASARRAATRSRAARATSSLERRRAGLTASSGPKPTAFSSSVSRPRSRSARPSSSTAAARSVWPRRSSSVALDRSPSCARALASSALQSVPLGRDGLVDLLGLSVARERPLLGLAQPLACGEQPDDLVRLLACEPVGSGCDDARLLERAHEIRGLVLVCLLQASSEVVARFRELLEWQRIEAVELLLEIRDGCKRPRHLSYRPTNDEGGLSPSLVAYCGWGPGLSGLDQ